MTETRTNLKYSKSHEWVRQEEDGSLTVGITDHAQTLLGDLVFVEAPEPGSQVQAGEPCATVESVKAASDVYAPVSGEVVAVNEELTDSPERVNESPFEEGWLFRVQPTDPAGLDALLDADAYAELVASEE
ncbi:Glycine cleavage system H protein [Thioalkalivibrio nitratireducens DSM 14787]|uniref:Glycine cleavage system H protein n=1 Tax=Thioalkalivibrio nitratireducens (strain DSM 14787 / UNIQEM 213 / ALEN2) TaxID=1255043 RepID=L0DT13_THIND|nr:glycine cleavage system protein GcvH [Thioalkalivibrio nitratireducens]AGA32749.1 Glycine cleavage system H protein [Thioalkalivibrio nitratireducens DSM 14787]